MRSLHLTDLDAVQVFTDREIGKGYFSRIELEDIWSRSTLGGVTYSLVLERTTDSGTAEIHGVRITFPPGRWSSGKGTTRTSELAPDTSTAGTLQKIGYFQSLFLSRETQGKGWGGKLSRHAIELLKQNAANGVTTHAWKESPNNSSMKYLAKLGFEIVREHPEYWVDVDYVCPRDGKPCHCTAVEMLLKF